MREATHILEPHGPLWPEGRTLCGLSRFESAISAENSLTKSGPERNGPIEEYDARIYCRSCINEGMMRIARLAKKGVVE